MRASLLVVVLALGALMMVGACSTPADSRFVVTSPPKSDDASFDPVGQVMIHHCGTIDCHGTRQRNLRLYGNEGLRLDPANSPFIPKTTQPGEYTEDYQSIVGLEPEIINAVVAEGGAHPERLTLVRKARGTEAHKGGAPIHEGDNSDICITSWLAGTTNLAACAAGLTP